MSAESGDNGGPMKTLHAMELDDNGTTQRWQRPWWLATFMGQEQ